MESAFQSVALEWVRPPQQARSQRTLERLLDAAEELIAEGGVEGLTVTSIVGRAESSVGAFYARFGDKDTLLRCLFERFYDQALATAASALEPQRWGDAPLREVLRAAIEFCCAVFSERRAIISALSSMFGAESGFASPAEVLSGEISAGLLTLIAARGETITHPDPIGAVRTCVWLVLGALSSWAHGGASPASPPGAPAPFATFVTDMILNHLFTARA